MSQRYSLRFESGERAGEVVPITGASFTVGRKPGNSLQIVENSVSGKHAELTLRGDELTLRDLSSTNGTRVGGEPIEQSILSAGVQISIGNVALTLLDGDIAAAPKVVAEESPRVISEESLARSAKAGRGSKLGLVAMAVIAAAGGGTWWWLNQGGGGEQRMRPVPTVAGNLLDGGSFEERGSWEAADDLPVSFQVTAGARYSGARGLGARVIEDESAEHHSTAIGVRRGAGLVARARVRAVDGARARVGLRFLPEPEEESTPGVTIIWSEPLQDTSGWQEVELSATLPGGYDRVELVLGADATSVDGGKVDLDDVSLTPGEGGAVGKIGEAEIFHDGGVLTLFKVDRVLLSSVQLRNAGGLTVSSELTVEPNLVRLRPAAAGTLTLRAEAPVLEGGVATLGEGGYQARDGEFEAQGVTDVLFGRDHNLVRVSLGGVGQVNAGRAGSGLELRITLASGAQPSIQLGFVEERRRAIELTSEARGAQDQGDWGRALSLWQQLLDEVPFDATSVSQAQAARAVLLQAGFEETRDLAAEVERARFFRLVDLFRQCRESADSIGSRYAGSEVEQRAQELIEAIDLDLAGLETELDRYEVSRLEAILAGLEAQEAGGLAAEVERYLAEEYGSRKEKEVQ